MMRSLYTAASGMRAQQTNLDVISNNLAMLIPQDIRHRLRNLNHFYIRHFRHVQQVLTAIISR